MADKFTPSPWRTGADYLGGTPIYIDNRHHVTVLRGKLSAAEHEANARLIAAAPELVTALRAMLGQYDDGAYTPEESPIAQARALLARIEGDAP